MQGEAKTHDITYKLNRRNVEQFQLAEIGKGQLTKGEKYPEKKRLREEMGGGVGGREGGEGP
jgi:hypothetical protein